MIERNLDYFQASALISEAELRDSNYQQTSAMKFYSRGYVDSFGFRYYFGNPNSKLALIVGAGQALQAARDYGLTDAEIVQRWLKAGAKVTRIDIAVTKWIDEKFVTIEDVEIWFKSGQITSNLCSYGAKRISSLSLDGNEYPETLYVGNMEKRGKKGIFRAYDKGVQLDLGQYLATRLEIEDRGEKAHNSAVRIAEGHALGSVFKSRFDVSNDSFQELMDAPAIDISRGQGKGKTEMEEKQDNRWAWLMEQVAPALRGLIAESRDKKETNMRVTEFLAASGILADAMKLHKGIVNLDNMD